MSAGPEHVLRYRVAQAEADRFWARCDRSGGPDACWPWTGCLSPNGYGHAKFPQYGSKKSERTHRIAFLIHSAWLPLGRMRGSLVIRHTCDNPPCCNPAHLIVGSHKQNAGDAIVRGRAVLPPVYHLDRHPRSRLTLEKVREARRDAMRGVGCAALARRFGVGETTMGHALAGRTWREVAHEG